MTSDATTPSRSFRSLLERWRQVVAGTALPQPPWYDGPDVTLTAVVEHTDRVKPGVCFVARVRSTSDGHRYVARAVAQGASLIVGQKAPEQVEAIGSGGTPYLQVEDTAIFMAWLSAAWEGFPGRQLVTIGITGTDGKSTTANLFFEILRKAGLHAGLLSTVRAVIGDVEEPLALHVTTPEAPLVQRFLRRMVDTGITHCVLEATSHGLAQHRVGAVDFDIAVVTNITHEHLDYHGDFEAYFAAKARLFELLQQPQWHLPVRNPYKTQVAKTAVLNRDDGSYSRLAHLAKTRQVTYALHDDADIQAGDVRVSGAATQFLLHLPGGDLPIRSGLIGEFNVYNMLAAAAAAHAANIGSEAIQEGLCSLSALSGRMEQIDEGQPFSVLVDFAHTPNALSLAIGAARRLSDGRIVAVFGSAGKRDVAKRRLMAEVATREADLVILTAEDPRTESLEAILATMAEGSRAQGGVEGEDFWRIADRGQAIYQAMALAKGGDVVLICGKGHEQSMCFGEVEYPWDDRQAARKALHAWQEGQPMPDLGLPTFDEEMASGSG